jgi:phosphate/sulfate permease
LLSLHFEHRFQGFFVRVWRSFVESLICAIGTGLAAYGMLVSIGQITFASTTASVVIHAFVAGFFGAVVGVLIYALMRNREYRETLETIRSRARGIIAPPTPSTVVVSAEEATTTSPQ